MTPLASRGPRRWLAAGIAVALLLAGAGAVAVAVLMRGDAGTHPEDWDPRVLSFVDVVEEQRALDFEHPVEVRFLTGKAFEREVTTDEEDLDADEREEIQQFGEVMRALGLVAGDVDLLDAINQASGAGTLAYYSDDDKRITIRGTELTTAVHATLVHELTHALQDQHFDIGSRIEELRQEESDGADTTAATVYQALVEGDAERVATLYRQSLSGEERRRLSDAEAKDQARVGPGLKGVPGVVRSIIGAPYVLGQALVELVAEDDGNDGVDELYADTPGHESVLLDPFEVIEDDVDPVEVDTPGLDEGDEEFDSGAFGALGWYFVLAERIPVPDALDVVDGWGGDAYVAFERRDRTCVRIAYAGDTHAETDRMQQALRRWDEAGPDQTASVSRDGGDLVLESCDPGKGSELGNDSSGRALQLAATRSYLGIGLLDAGAPAAQARCIAGQAVQELPVSALTGPDSGKGRAFVRRIQSIAADCARQ